jgi:hypothetical protein
MNETYSLTLSVADESAHQYMQHFQDDPRLEALGIL